MTGIRTLDDVDVTDRRVLVRADLNVPLDDDGGIRDATRIERILPTAGELLDRQAAVILLSHFGRPKGRPVDSMSLRPVAEALGGMLGRPVGFAATDWRDDVPSAIAGDIAPGDVVVMENTRFHPGEEADDPEFAKILAQLGDIYVNDAFSAAHRAHASTHAAARMMTAVAGRAMTAELDALALALDTPDRPVVAVAGGAKVSTKLDLLGSLCRKVDTIVIGGGMANTFLAALGRPIGRSLCEHDLADTARSILSAAQEAGCDIMLPSDVVVASKFEANAPHRTAAVDEVGDGDMILDVGAATIAGLEMRFKAGRTVLWNGPLGAFEIAPFDRGTNAAAACVAALTDGGGLRSVAGGGDTVAALNNAGVAQHFTYISTAGGAFLEWLEGRELPGVEVLRA